MKKATAKKPKAVKAAVKSPEPENCGACRFWRDELCRRFPPLKVPGEAIGRHRVMTAATDWCGEFQRAN